MDTSLLFGFGATVVTAILGSSVITAWITSRAQKQLTSAQARGEEADAAAAIVGASTEFVKNVVDRVTALEQKVIHLEANQARLIAQLHAHGIEPDLIPAPAPFDTRS